MGEDNRGTPAKRRRNTNSGDGLSVDAEADVEHWAEDELPPPLLPETTIHRESRAKYDIDASDDVPSSTPTLAYMRASRTRRFGLILSIAVAATGGTLIGVLIAVGGDRWWFVSVPLTAIAAIAASFVTTAVTVWTGVVTRIGSKAPPGQATQGARDYHMIVRGDGHGLSQIANERAEAAWIELARRRDDQLTADQRTTDGPG